MIHLNVDRDKGISLKENCKCHMKTLAILRYFLVIFIFPQGRKSEIVFPKVKKKKKDILHSLCMN